MLMRNPFADAIYADNPYPPDEPEDYPEQECQGGCFRMLDPDDLVHGWCEDCAREEYDDVLGVLYANDYTDAFMDFLDGKRPQTESECRALYKEFALDDMTAWREWLTGHLRGGSYGKLFCRAEQH